MTEKVLTEKIQARHQFTDKERLGLCDKLAAAMRQKAGYESELGSIKATYKGKLEGVSLDIKTLQQQYCDGYEMRETLAVKVLNHPSVGRKCYFVAVTSNHSELGASMECGSLIEECAMTFDEKNPPLPMEVPQKTTATFGDGETPSIDRLPLGTVLVTEGVSQEGDWCWIDADEPEGKGSWEAVAGDGISFDYYTALARPSVAIAPTSWQREENMTAIERALNEEAMGQTLPQVRFTVDLESTPAKIASAFVKAAGKYGWNAACVAILRDEVKKCETAEKARETLRPHIIEEAA